MKKLKLSLFALPFVALLFSGCDNVEPAGEQGGTTPPSGQKSEIDQVVEIVMQDLSATNFTYDLYAESNNSDYSSVTTQTMERDGNKYHSISNTVILDQEYPSEFYLEVTEDKNYIYNKYKETWVKMEDTSGMSLDFRDSVAGFSEGLEAFKVTYTVDKDGNYYAENVEYNVKTQALIDQIGSIMYKDYVCTQEYVTFKNEYIKIGVANGHLSLYESKSTGVGMNVDEKNKTITFYELENQTAVTKIHNIRNFGTTVVTLPVVE